MSASNIPVYTCDRCGVVQQITESYLLYEWGTICAFQKNGPFRIGESKFHPAASGVDICPSCTRSLEQWWSGK